MKTEDKRNQKRKRREEEEEDVRQSVDNKQPPALTLLT